MQFPCLLPFKSIPSPEVVILTTGRKLIWQNIKAALFNPGDLWVLSRCIPSRMSPPQPHSQPLQPLPMYSGNSNRAELGQKWPRRYENPNVPEENDVYLSSLWSPAWFLFHQRTNKDAVCSQHSFSSSNLREKSLYWLASFSNHAFGAREKHFVLEMSEGNVYHYNGTCIINEIFNISIPSPFGINS